MADIQCASQFLQILRDKEFDSLLSALWRCLTFRQRDLRHSYGKAMPAATWRLRRRAPAPATNCRSQLAEVHAWPTYTKTPDVANQ